MNYSAEVGKKCGLKGQLDAREDAAGPGFLPGVIDAMDDGERRNYGDDPQHRPHAIEEAADDEQHEALGAFHKADLTQGNEGLGPGARITDHHGARGGDRGQHDVGSPTAHGVVDQQAHVQGHVRVAVQRRIVECAESGDAVLPPRYLPIQHVQEAGEKNDQRAGKKTTHGKEGCRDEIHNQPKKCQEIGIDARGSQIADNFVEQPLAAGSDRSSKRSHIRLVVSQNQRTFAKWN
jgi:hypothetical protein